jgi:hypothetical protein
MMDDISVIRGCYSDQFDHAPAIYLRSTGSQIAGRPSLGSWVTYGLGTENQNLPAFVVMSDGSTKSGPPAYGSGFLPAVYQGQMKRAARLMSFVVAFSMTSAIVPCRRQASPGKGIDRQIRFSRG